MSEWLEFGLHDSVMKALEELGTFSELQMDFYCNVFHIFILGWVLYLSVSFLVLNFELVFGFGFSVLVLVLVLVWN
jgi:hypothetical protein